MAQVFTHPYERSLNGDYCGSPDPTTVVNLCTRPPEHPVHATERTDIEHLARQLAGHQWRTEPEGVGPRTEHRRHEYSSDCALCTQDLHAIAAAILAIQAVRSAGGPYILRVDQVDLPGLQHEVYDPGECSCEGFTGWVGWDHKHSGWFRRWSDRDPGDLVIVHDLHTPAVH